MKRCRWRERLKNNGFRLTLSREVIIDVLKNTDKHLSAEDIYMAIHNKHPEIGLTTIYRTLDILNQMGITEKFEFGDRRARYELSEDYGNKPHHHHLICTGCARIIDYSDFMDFELEYLKLSEKHLSDKHHFDIKSHIINFYGLCESCKKAG